MKKLRVLEVMARSAGGVGKHVSLLTRALDGADGIEIDIAAPGDVAVAMPKPVLPLSIPRGAGLGHLDAVLQLRRLVADGRYELVHGHGLRAGFDAALAVRTRGPAIVTLHNLIRPESSGPVRAMLFRRAEGRVIRLADHVFVASNQMRDELAARAPAWAAKVETIHIAVESPVVERTPDEVRKELGVGERTRLLVTVARLVPQKGLDVMIRAVARVPEVLLALVGDGRLRNQLQQVARETGVESRVRFLGWRDSVGDYMAAADVFCLSSHWEARALAAQEAMLLGTPVVSTDVGGMGELIQDRVSGRLVPAADPAALAAALQESLADPAALRRYAEEAKRRMTELSDGATLELVRARYLGYARDA